MDNDWHYTEQPDRCEICGELVAPFAEVAEMYDPKKPDAESVFCHAQCGLWKDMEIA